MSESDPKRDMPTAPDDVPRVTVLVCTNCRGEDGSDAEPRPGRLLAEAARDAAAGSNVEVRGINCLGNCKRRLSAAMTMPGAWSYVFGDLDIANAPELVDGALLFTTTENGLLPWRGRPDCLKRGLVARVPPLASSDDTL